MGGGQSPWSGNECRRFCGEFQKKCTGPASPGKPEGGWFSRTASRPGFELSENLEGDFLVVSLMKPVNSHLGVVGLHDRNDDIEQAGVEVKRHVHFGGLGTAAAVGMKNADEGLPAVRHFLAGLQVFSGRDNEAPVRLLVEISERFKYPLPLRSVPEVCGTRVDVLGMMKVFASHQAVGLVGKRFQTDLSELFQ